MRSESAKPRNTKKTSRKLRNTKKTNRNSGTLPGPEEFVYQRPYSNRADMFHPSVTKTETSIISGDKLLKSVLLDSRSVLLLPLPSGDGDRIR